MTAEEITYLGIWLVSLGIMIKFSIPDAMMVGGVLLMIVALVKFIVKSLEN